METERQQLDQQQVEPPTTRGRKPKVAKPDISDLSQPFGEDSQHTSGETHD
jgi:hypothetical protein